MLERVNLFPSLWNAWKWWGRCYGAVQSVLSVVSQSDNALLSMSVCERHVSGTASEVYWSDHHCGRLQWVAWALPVVPFDSIESIRVLTVLEKYSVQVRGAAGVKPPALKSRKQEIVSLRFFMMCMVYKTTSPMRSCASPSNTEVLYYHITINSHSFIPSVSLSSKGKVWIVISHGLQVVQLIPPVSVILVLFLFICSWLSPTIPWGIGIPLCETSGGEIIWRAAYM